MEQLAKRKGSGQVGSDRIKFALDETAPEELFFVVMSANTKVASLSLPLFLTTHLSTTLFVCACLRLCLCFREETTEKLGRRTAPEEAAITPLPRG